MKMSNNDCERGAGHREKVNKSTFARFLGLVTGSSECTWHVGAAQKCPRQGIKDPEQDIRMAFPRSYNEKLYLGMSFLPLHLALSFCV